MKVKTLVEMLMRLPLDQELTVVRETHHGRVDYDIESLRVEKSVVPQYAYTAQTPGGERYEIQGIEETSERCIMVIS